MARPILVDTTRLLTRLKHRAPTGVDRVDLAYARHFLQGAYDGRAAAVTPSGLRLMPRDAMLGMFAAIETRWKEAASAEGDTVLAGILRRLSAEVRPDATADAAPRPAPRVSLDDLRRTVASLSWSDAAKAAPPGSVYIHTSHLRLDRPGLFDWFEDRRDVRSLFFVHDIIPIDSPEYAVPGEDRRHRVRMATVSSRAAAVVVSSRAVAERFSSYLASEKLRVPPIEIAPIGVEPVFQREPEMRLRTQRPYFVVCSTIEARKNHLLLLQVWRELAERLGRDTPALVVVGRRGWESENVIDLLERCPAIRDHVIEVSGLSTPALACLVGSARALLMPSFAEGYGIPVVEALSLGTPVIASDIPVHREVTAGLATLLHPLDGLGWRDAILKASAPETARSTTASAVYRAPLWPDHFQAVDQLVRSL